MTALADKDFKQIVRHAPLLSIDLLIRDGGGCLLLGLRNNEPARGTYFVPGGCVRKGETVENAFARILKEETGLSSSCAQVGFFGIYEQFYLTNRFRDPDFGTHYVSLAYELAFADRPAITLDQQHSEYRWMQSYQDIAHPYTKAYFGLPAQR